MAKSFFYVCAGVLALVVAAGLGFNSGNAQASGPVYFAGVGGASAAVVGRTLTILSTAEPTPTPFPAPVPGTSDIVSVLVYNAGYMPPATTVVLANGDVYHWSGAVPGWALVGSYSGATPSRSTTWSELKSRYR
jgi:hypothetical protein